MHQGFVKIAAAAPRLHLGNVTANQEEILKLWHQADEQGALCVVFPRLSLTGATCGDLFAMDLLRNKIEPGLAYLLERSKELRSSALIGMPVKIQDSWYEALLLICQGKLIAASVCKEGSRWFAAGEAGMTLDVAGQLVKTDAADITLHGVSLAIAWQEKDIFGVSAGICLMSAAKEAIAGDGESLSQMLVQASRIGGNTLVYAQAGPGESSGHNVYAGECMIASRGELVERGARFVADGQFICADVETVFLAQTDAMELLPPRYDLEKHFTRKVDPHPFYKEDPAFLDEIFTMQVQSIVRRMRSIGITKLVLAMSGGLDSTMALMVASGAMEEMGLPPSNIISVSMPGLATGSSSRKRGGVIMERLQVDTREISIAQSCRDMLAQIGHDGQTHDVTYENVQARLRTQIVLNIANMEGALQMGTGDMSELALGFCTFGGDQIGMYNVNGGLPKTAMQALLRHLAQKSKDQALKEALLDVVSAPISPELTPDQNTEDVVGPYQLNDFFLYHTLRCGMDRDMLLFLSKQAFCGTFDKPLIEKTLDSFLRRFYTQQFKRNGAPDGPALLGYSLDAAQGFCMPADL